MDLIQLKTLRILYHFVNVNIEVQTTNMFITQVEGCVQTLVRDTRHLACNLDVYGYFGSDFIPVLCALWV